MSVLRWLPGAPLALKLDFDANLSPKLVSEYSPTELSVTVPYPGNIGAILKLSAKQMSGRFDLSDRLIHFTKGEPPEDAFAVLSTIIRERRLMGANGKIRGGYSVSALQRRQSRRSQMLMQPDFHLRGTPSLAWPSKNVGYLRRAVDL